LTAGQIAAIVVGVVVFIALIVTSVVLCICCLTPTCPIYYNKSRITRTVVVAQPAPQIVTATTATASTIQHQPAAPPTYNPDTGYQPYPAAPPTATTAKY